MAKIIKQKPQVAIVMGSSSDWETMKNASLILKQFGVLHERKVVSAHRTPEYMCEFAKTAKSNGIKVIIAGAGGAAHLPGMIAAQTSLPVLGVPVKSSSLNGIDSLLSIVQMPAGVPVGTLAIGAAGAKNAAYLAIQILGLDNSKLQDAIEDFRGNEKKRILKEVLK